MGARNAVVWVAIAAGTCAGRPGAAQDGRREAEVRWAKRTAAEFFDLITSGEGDAERASTPKALLSPGLVKAEEEKGLKSVLVELAWRHQGARFRATAEEVAPNGSEVILTGLLEPPAGAGPGPEGERDLATALLGPRERKTSEVTVRVGKETEGGRWVIHLIRLKERPARPKD